MVVDGDLSELSELEDEVDDDEAVEGEPDASDFAEGDSALALEDDSETVAPDDSPDLTSCFDSIFLLPPAPPLFLKSVTYQPPPFN